MSNRAITAAGPVVEKFAPASGRWLGWLGVAVGTAIAVIALVDDAGRDWAAVGIGVAIALVSWVVLIRPQVSVHKDGVLMRNMVRDSYLPFSTIERCKASQTLMVYAAGRTFHGLGISRSARSVMREQRGRGASFGMMSGITGGFGGGRQPVEEPVHRFANEEQTGGTYHQYVESRIQTAATTAPDDGADPVVAADLIALGALVVSAVALLGPLLL